MKLTFLGTSHGVPESDRFCSSTLIEIEDRSYLIDAGAPVTELLLQKGKRLEDVKAMFITHAHGDHVNGLIEFVDIISWFFKNADPTIYYPEQGLPEALDVWLNMLFGGSLPSKRLNFVLEKEGKIYDDGLLSVTAIPNDHMKAKNRPSYSLLLEAEGKKVLFTGDLAAGMEDFPKIAFEETIDLVITEAAHTHLDNNIGMFSKLKTRFFGINHIYAKANPPEAIEKLKAGLEIPVRVFADGDVFEV